MMPCAIILLCASTLSHLRDGLVVRTNHIVFCIFADLRPVVRAYSRAIGHAQRHFSRAIPGGGEAGQTLLASSGPS